MKLYKVLQGATPLFDGHNEHAHGCGTHRDDPRPACGPGGGARPRTDPRSARTARPHSRGGDVLGGSNRCLAILFPGHGRSRCLSCRPPRGGRSATAAAPSAAEQVAAQHEGLVSAEAAVRQALLDRVYQMRLEGWTPPSGVYAPTVVGSIQRFLAGAKFAFGYGPMPGMPTVGPVGFPQAPPPAAVEAPTYGADMQAIVDANPAIGAAFKPWTFNQLISDGEGAREANFLPWEPAHNYSS